MTTYFSYGANMDPVHMAEHCPGATRLGLATLPDYRMGVAAAGFGNARPEPGGAIHGILWRLTDADEAALDRFEDVAGGFYRKATVPVRLPDGTPVSAMIYQAVDDAPGVPNEPYFARIVAVAAATGLPAEYVGELRRLGAGAPAQPQRG